MRLDSEQWPVGPAAGRAAARMPADRSLAAHPRFEVWHARHPDSITESMALRHRVFVAEMGAASNHAYLESDHYDAYCEHVIVRERATGAVVATSRVLLPDRAEALGCCYTDGEFWLTRLAALRPQMAELGRTCVAREHRDGLVIRLMWSGVQGLLGEAGCRWLIGAVSVPVADGMARVAAISRELANRCPAPEPWRVWPRRRLDLTGIRATETVSLPPLIKSYVRMGARLLGDPHWDPAFGTADFPMMIDLAELDPRLLRRLAEPRGVRQLSTGCV